MKESYLEITFRKGRPIAAYLYLPRQGPEKSYRTSRADPGLIVDYSRSGKPIGIEITAPTKVTAAALNRVLRDIGMPTIKSSDLGPLPAA